jgi:hypothetical protein
VNSDLYRKNYSSSFKHNGRVDYVWPSYERGPRNTCTCLDTTAPHSSDSLAAPCLVQTIRKRNIVNYILASILISSPVILYSIYTNNVKTGRKLGYHSNESSSVNKLHERKLINSRPRTKDQSFVSVFRVYSVSIYNISMWGDGVKRGPRRINR